MFILFCLMNMLTNYLLLMGQKYRNFVWSPNVLEPCTSKNSELSALV